MVKGLSPTWCQVSDMSRAVAFYRDGLGLELVSESPWWSEFKVGDFVLALHHRLEEGNGPLGEVGKGWYIGLDCADLASLRLMATKYGGTDHGLHEIPGGVVVTLSDPDGNPLQVRQAGVKISDFD